MSSSPGDKDRVVILYDGLCGLCDALNRFILKRDASSDFYYAALQAPYARELLARHGRSPEPVDTLYVVRQSSRAREQLLSKSRAVLFILARLGGLWRAAGLLRILPPVLTDCVYDVVARNRYRVFGRYEACRRPPPEARDRFLDV